ncbi:MAG: transglutaminase domain-containing protein [Planctomyces sp.]|nr:transglutaminase domain-containing protein [Planctomyces sp.]
MSQLVRSLTVFALIVSFSSCTAAATDFVPIIGWNEQLFPSYIISTATMKHDEFSAEEDAEEDEASEEEETTEAQEVIEDEDFVELAEVLGDERGLLGVEIVSPGRNVTVRVTITCDEIMEPTTFVETLSEEGKTYHILPKIKYKYGKLAEINQVTPVTMTFKVQIGKKEAREISESVTVRPINDCPFVVNYDDGYVDDISYTFAAYVNEQHPFLDKVLREALDYEIVDSFYGYQGEDADVIRQVYAIWDVLVARDVRYSSITSTSATADMVYSQHVRLIEQSLNNSQANCVDGSVLFASLLRKIGVEPFLVIVPGHCYVGFYVDKSHEKLLAIETTMLGTSYEEGEEFQSYEVLNQAVPEELRDPASWPGFTSAIVSATSNIVENSEKFQSEENADYLLIEISEARRRGILPIAFRGKEKFENRSGSFEESFEVDEEAEDEE